jgi:hypothetical protein
MASIILLSSQFLFCNYSAKLRNNSDGAKHFEVITFKGGLGDECILGAAIPRVLADRELQYHTLSIETGEYSLAGCESIDLQHRPELCDACREIFQSMPASIKAMPQT